MDTHYKVQVQKMMFREQRNILHSLYCPLNFNAHRKHLKNNGTLSNTLGKKQKQNKTKKKKKKSKQNKTKKKNQQKTK